MNAARKLLLGLLLCPLGMQGQTLVSAEYFVDTDPGVGNGTAIPVTPGATVSTPLNVPTGALSAGFHRIGVRHRDSNGRWSHAAARSVFVYAASFPAAPGAPIAAGEYFFDTDPGVGNGIAFPVTQGNTTSNNVVVDASLLTPGFHRLGVRHKDAEGRWGHAASRSLFVYAPVYTAPPSPAIVAGEYFFDADPGVGNGTAFPVTAGNTTSTAVVIDVSALGPGFHRVGLRHKDASGTWGHSASRSLYIFAPTFTEPPAAPIVAGEYFFDTDPGVGNGTAFPVTTGNITSTPMVVDVSALSAGFHRVCVRHKDANGKWGHSASRSLFIYAPSFTEPSSPAIVAGEYFFDTDPGVGNGTAFPVTAGITTNTTVVIDVSALGAGFHRVGVRHKDASGKWGHASARNLYIYEPAFTEPPSPAIVVGEYFFDADPGVGNGIAFSTGAAANSIAVDVTYASNTLPPGPHKVSVRVKDAAGRWGHTSTQSFTVEDGGQAYRTIASGNWADPAIWERDNGGVWVPAGASPSHVSGTITVRNGHSVTVTSATSMDEVTVESGGALTISATATVMDGVGFDVDVSGSLTLASGGLLTGPGTVRIVHQFFWTGGTTDTGLQLVVTSTGTASVNCGCTLVHGGTIQNSGTWTVVNGNLSGTGTFNNLLGGVLSIQGAFDINNAWGIALYNAGSVQVNVALHYTFTTSVFVNQGGGTVTVGGGELYLNGFTNSGGVICTGSGIIRVVGGSFVNNAGGYATGAYIIVNGGNLVVNSSLTILNLHVLSGTVSGGGGVSVLGGGSLVCTGGTIAAGCTVDVAVTAVVTFNAPTIFYNYGSIIVGGTWNHVSGSLHGNGSVTVLSTAVVTVTGVWDPYDSWQNSLVCQGAINVNVPVAFAFTGQVDVEVTGVVTVVNGILYTYGFNNGGTLVCVGSSVLRISGGTFVHEVGGTTTTAGIILAGGTLIAQAPLDILHFWLEGGTLQGPQPVNVIGGGSFTWTGGTIHASCVLNLAVGVVSVFNPTVSVYCHGVIYNGGTWNYNGGNLLGGGAFHNLAGGIVHLNGVLDVDLSWALVFYNYGIVNKVTSLVFTHYSSAFYNYAGGVVNVLAGEYRFKGGYFNHGSITTTGLAELCGCGGTFTNENGGEALNGRVVIREASLVVNWAFEVKHFKLDNSGQVFGPFEVKVVNGGTFVWLGGTIEATAIVDLAINVITTFNPSVSVFCHGIIHHHGTWNFDGGDLKGNGTFHNYTGAIVHLNGVLDTDLSWRLLVYNAGEFRKVFGGVFTHYATLFHNQAGGVVNILAGEYRFKGGFTNYGSIITVGLAELCGCGGTFTNENGGEALNGRVVIREAPLVVNWAFEVKHFKLDNGGQVFGPFEVKVVNGGTFVWLGGTIEATAIVDLAINVITTFNPSVSVFCHGIIHHRGTWNFVGGNLHGTGIFNNYASGLIHITGVLTGPDAWRVVLNNAGIYRMNCGCLFRHASGTFANLAGGRLEVLQGTLVLDGVFTGDQYGQVHVSLGAVLDITTAVDWKGDVVVCNGLLQCPDLRFKGIMAQTMGGDGTYTHVRFDNAMGIDLQGNVKVSVTVILVNGHVRCGDYHFTLENPLVSALVGGGINTRFVCDGLGSFRRAIAGGGFFYPVGTTTRYSPVTLSLTSGPQDICGVRVRPTLNTAYGAPGVEIGTTVIGDAVGCAWVLDETVGGGNSFDITVQWEGVQELAGFIRTNCAIAHYTPGGWVTGPWGPATGADPYMQTIVGLTDPQEIAVVDPDADLGGDVVDCLGVPGGSALPGSPCDDGNAGTTADTWTSDCDCEGTPVLACTTDLVLELRTDANGAQITWEIRQQGTGDLVESGGGTYPNNVTFTDQTCLPNGCYYLRVLDSGGDGIVGGGYILRTLTGAQRIIDNRDNGSNFTSISAVIGNGGFCLPLGTDKLIYTSCDKLDWVNNQFIVAAENPGVSAQWGIGDQTDDGYQFWWFDPNGTYGYSKFRSHATSDGFGPANAVRACHARINNWSPNQIPAMVLMNVKVRSRVNGVNSNWGPVCRFKIDPVRATCPLTKLMDIPGNVNYSCGVTRAWGSGAANKVVARPVEGATQYQFRFTNGELASPVVRTTTTPLLQLNWTPALDNGTYEVQVRAYKNGQWCVTSLPWGDVCNVTITGSPNAMVLGGGSTTSTGDVKLALFPNPNNGQQLTVSLSAVEAGVETVAVDIFDLNGARVSSQVIAVNDGMVYQVVDVAGLADGLYMVNITAGEQRYTERLVIAK